MMIQLINSLAPSTFFSILFFFFSLTHLLGSIPISSHSLQWHGFAEQGTCFWNLDCRCILNFCALLAVVINSVLFKFMIFSFSLSEPQHRKFQLPKGRLTKIFCITIFVVFLCTQQ